LSNPVLEHLALNIVSESCGVPEEQYWRTLKAMESCDQWWSAEFGREHDHFRLIGQDNARRYLPLRAVHVRVNREDSFFEIFTRVAATRVTGARTIVSRPHGLDTRELSLLEKLTHDWAGLIEFVEESDEEFAEAIGGGHVCRVRYAAADRVPEIVRRAAAEVCMFIADAPVLAEGRVELLWYVQEQSVSFDYHRYGNLGTRTGEDRALLVASGGNSD
jgi:RHH-type proline utilization regulon transcriptional repressor/proline dehydrogenase/delta 1-pyrroline-5-carboxylate dehydrogenase